MKLTASRARGVRTCMLAMAVLAVACSDPQVGESDQSERFVMELEPARRAPTVGKASQQLPGPGKGALDHLDAPSRAAADPNCVPTVAVESNCDGLDNDCDGDTDENYDDGIACTVSTCEDGKPKNTPNHALCDDANPCTSDTCTPNMGGCVNYAVKATDVDVDANPCTKTVCVEGVAKSVPDDKIQPSDGLDCTVDTCKDGVAQHVPVADTCSVAGACVEAGDYGGVNNCGVCNPQINPYGLQPGIFEEDFEYAATQPCLNGGSCTPDGLGHRCECLDGTAGKHCELKAQNKVGTIKKNETWSGLIHIIGNIAIPQGVTVTVTPGSTVVFKGNSRRIAIGSGGNNGRLIIRGKPGQRIRLETAAPFTPGYIEGATYRAELQLSHVDLFRVGTAAKPAINLYVKGGTKTNAGDVLIVEDCTFTQCGLLKARTYNGSESDPLVRIKRNDFRESVETSERTVWVTSANAQGEHTIHQNTSDGAFLFRDFEGEVTDNVVVAVKYQPLNARFQSGTILRGNVFRSEGGTYAAVIFQSSEIAMTDNVFWTSAFGKYRGLSAYASDLSRVERNLFLADDNCHYLAQSGPHQTWSRNLMVSDGCSHISSSRMKSTQINQNTFVGGPGVRLGGLAAGQASLSSDVFYDASLGVRDNNGITNSITKTNHNLFYEIGPCSGGPGSNHPNCRYNNVKMTGKTQGNHPDFGDQDIVSQPLFFSPNASIEITAATLLSRKVTPRELIEAYREAFTPLPESPLIDAAAPTLSLDWEVKDGAADIGAVEFVASCDDALTPGILTNMEPVDWLPGHMGQSVLLDGVDEYVGIGAVGGEGDIGGRASFTLSLWVKPSSDGKRAFYGTGTHWFGHHGANGPDLAAEIKMADGQTVTLQGGVSLSSDSWTHVALTYDGMRLRLWHQGQVVDSAAASGALAISKAWPTLGASGVSDAGNGSLFYTGQLDDVRVYRRGLSKAGIRDVAGISPCKPHDCEVMAGDLVAHWMFDDGIGLTATDAAGHCLNDAICVDKPALGATCSCPAPYAGQRCQFNVNDCVPNPCLNGGACTDGISAAVCTCPEGYEGKTCEIDLSSCSASDGEGKWTFEKLASTPVGWSFVKKRAATGKQSLYFGDPTTWTYAHLNKRVHAQVTGPVMALPPDTLSILSFKLFLDTEEYTQTTSIDVLMVEVIDAAGKVHEVWDSTTHLQGTTQGTFASVSVSLAEFEGQSVALRFRFDSGDGTGNAFEGAYIDAVDVHTACCETAVECDDGDPCTLEICNQGTCEFQNQCGQNCGQAQANMLLLVDFSDSMNDPASPGSETTRYEATIDAIGGAVGVYGSVVSTGLKLFRTPGSVGWCTVQETNNLGEPYMDQPFGSSAWQLTGYMGQQLPSGATPLSKALSAAKFTYQNAKGLHNDRFALLIVDGKETCGGKALEKIQQLAQMGVTTHIIGYGDDLDFEGLSEMAIAGGHGLPGKIAFRHVVNAKDLREAIEAVYAQVAGERCNGLDDTCSGSADDGIAPLTCRLTCDGKILDGFRYCAGGVWGACGLDQSAEICNGLDDNCSGIADDPWVDGEGPVLGEECLAGQGVCAVPGVAFCPASGKGEAVCEPIQPYGPSSPEICDGLDNDCDGDVDEGLQQACSTPCGTGVETCYEGIWANCTAAACDADTQCDGIDNDEDGVIDNLFPSVGKACDGPDADFCDDELIQCTSDTTSSACMPVGLEIAIWGFDDKTGLKALDGSGKGHHGQLKGGATFGEGQTTGAVDLSESQAYVVAGIDLPEENFTISAWFNTTADGGIFAATDGNDFGSNGHDRHLYVKNGRLAYRVYPGGTSKCVNQGPKLFICTAENAPQTCPDHKSVLRYTYDEADVDFDGKVLSDASGHGHNATIADQTYFKPGRWQDGLELTYFEGYVYTPVDLPEENFTMSTWFKTTADGGIFSVVAGDPFGSEGHDRHLFVQGGRLGYRVYPGSTSKCKGQGPLVTDGKWHMGTIVCETGVDCRLYLDGELICDSSASHAKSGFTWQKGLIIGYSSDAGYHQGRIDETTVDAWPMSAEEVKTLYLNGPAAKTGAWHVGVIRCETGVSCSLFLDGKKICESNAADSKSKFDWQTKATIGHSSDGGFFPGLIDHVTVTDTPLSDADIAEQASGGHPDMDQVEKCNGFDDDCNGVTDEVGAFGCVKRWADADGDGYGVGDPICLCEPEGLLTAPEGGDCDDTDATVHPGVEDVCDGIDNDCDGGTDTVPNNPAKLLSEPCYSGAKGTQGVGACKAGKKTCKDGEWTSCLGEVTPMAETCDGTDQDCDGLGDLDEPGWAADVSEHPCYDDPSCAFGDCFCEVHDTSGAWACILD